LDRLFSDAEIVMRGLMFLFEALVLAGRPDPGAPDHGEAEPRTAAPAAPAPVPAASEGTRLLLTEQVRRRARRHIRPA
jgi:hypothetical protein